MHILYIHIVIGVKLHLGYHRYTILYWPSYCMQFISDGPHRVLMEGSRKYQGMLHRTSSISNLFDRFKSCRVFSVTILISISDFYREYFALFSKMMWCTDDLVTFFFSLSSPGVRQKQTSHDIPDMRNRRTMVVIYFWSIYTHKDLGTCFLTSLRVTI